MQISDIWDSEVRKPLSELVIAILSVVVCFSIVEVCLEKLRSDFYGLTTDVVVNNGFTYVGRRIHEINTAPETSGRTFIVGGSVSRELTLQEGYGAPVISGTPLYNLAFSNQSVYQSLAVLDSLDLRPDDIILFQLSEKRVAQSVDVLPRELKKAAALGLAYGRIAGIPWPLEVLRRKYVEARELVPFFERNSCGSDYFLKTDTSECFKTVSLVRNHYRAPIMSRDKKQDEFQRTMSVLATVSHDGLRRVEKDVREEVARIAPRVGRFYLVEFPTDSVETRFIQNYKSNVFDVADMCCEGLPDNVVFVASDSFKGFEDDDFYDSQHLIPAGKVKMKTYVEQMIDAI